MTSCHPHITLAHRLGGPRRLSASVDIPPPTPDVVPLPTSPHPTPPSPAPVPPEIIEPPDHERNAPVREPILPTPGLSLSGGGRLQ